MLRSIPSALRIAAAHKPAAGIDGCTVSAKVAAGENAFHSHYRGEARFPSPDPHPMAAMRHGGPGNASHQALWNLIVPSLRHLETGAAILRLDELRKPIGSLPLRARAAGRLLTEKLRQEGIFAIRLFMRW
jgi:hypothetical protein